MSIKTISDLEQAVRNILDEDLCIDIVNQAFSEDGLFDTKVFMDSDTFFDMITNEESRDVALMFFNGKDLDSRGSANPNRDYFRLNSYDNVESTNDPGAIYYNELFDELVDYIIEHSDEDVDFPDTIQELIDEYLNNVED